MKFDRKIYFDSVRDSLFGGVLAQHQVDGQEAILAHWEANGESDDLRHLAYPLATTMWETSATMMPIEEYGKGAGQSYGVPDPETGETYYGRGFVQLTWRDNYARADRELGLIGKESCEWHAEHQLEPDIATQTMFQGMWAGWFRGDDKGRQTLERYFNESIDDPFGAREIINGDKHVVPDWSNGVSIGNLIAGYHQKFLDALTASRMDVPAPTIAVVTITITAPPGVEVIVRQECET